MLESRVHKILSMYGAQIVVNIQRELRANNNVASGKALNSLRQKITHDNGRIELDIIGERYLQALDTGRKAGKQPSSKKIEDWIRSKRNFALRDKGGRFVAKTERNIKRAAYAIARGIGRKGTRPYNLLEYAFKPVEKKIVADIVVAFVEEELNNMIKNKTLKI